MVSPLRATRIGWLVALAALAISMHAYGSDPVEVVLAPNMSIAFFNKFGRGSIVYVAPLKRRYVIEGTVDKTVTMIPRAERFLGELGIYNPAERSIFSLDRSLRIVTREAELHFVSVTEAQRQLREGSEVFDWVYNSQGYVVGYGTDPKRSQINVTLYRFFIGGKPARNMAGFDDTKVIVKEGK